jgi:hypothetical protein
LRSTAVYSSSGGGGLSSGVKAAIIVPSVLLGIALCFIGGAMIRRPKSHASNMYMSRRI